MGVSGFRKVPERRIQRMTIRKSLTAILAAGMLLSQSVRAAAAAPIQDAQKEILSQQALQYNQYYAAGPVNQKAIGLMAFGLIYESNAYVSVAPGGLYLTTRTSSRNIVRRIGLTEVKLEYSPDGHSNWTTATNLGSFLNSNSSSHRITNRYIPATNGTGYYRINLKHTAYNNISDPQKIQYISEPKKIYC